MTTPIYIGIAGFVVVLLIIWNIIHHRRFLKREALHRELASDLTLHIAYTGHREFTIFGKFRDYQVKIIPYDRISGFDMTQYLIPMINPNLKWLKISKNPQQAMPEISSHDKAMVVKHDISKEISIETNDMVFSSLILSDNVKISIHDTFKNLEAGQLFIEGDVMAFVSPYPLRNSIDIQDGEKIINLMCDMKDELN